MELWIALAAFITIDIALLFFVLSKKRKNKFSESEQKKFQEHWHKIINEQDQSKAIMAADNLLDLALRKKGYQGSLGEKLQKARSLFSSNNDVWFAHKLRNRLAHELHAHVSGSESSKALHSFKKALLDLGIKL